MLNDLLSEYSMYVKVIAINPPEKAFEVNGDERANDGCMPLDLNLNEMSMLIRI